MKTQAQIDAWIAELNEAVRMLPDASDGLRATSNGHNFEAHKYHDGATNKEALEWELMTKAWEPTALVWSASLANVKMSHEHET